MIIKIQDQVVLSWIGLDSELGGFWPRGTTKKLLSPPRRILCAVVLELQVPGSKNWSSLLLLRSNNIASDGLGLRPISSEAKEGGKKDKGAAAAEEVVEAAGREQGQGGDDDNEVSASVSDKGGASCHAQQTQSNHKVSVKHLFGFLSQFVCPALLYVHLLLLICGGTGKHVPHLMNP
jgi:hypothetical protein